MKDALLKVVKQTAARNLFVEVSWFARKLRRRGSRA